MQLRIENLRSFQKMRHPFYFQGFRTAVCDEYNAELYPGINFAFCGFLDEGWPVSYTLCMGKTRYPWEVEGNFYIDGEPVSFSALKKLAYYVGYSDRNLKNIPLKKLVGRFEKDKAAEIAEQLHIEDWLLERPLSNTGHRLFQCSAMIGLLKGKKILCYPWLERGETQIQVCHLKALSEYAKRNDVIVIVPSEDMSEFQKEIIRKEFRYNIICGKVIYGRL